MVETELVPVELDQPLEVMQEEYTTTPMSASAKILKAIDVPVSIEPVECNVVITHLLTEFFIKLNKCPECSENVDIYHDNDNKKVLAHFFVVKCTSELCHWSDTFTTSKTLTSNQRGRKAILLLLLTNPR